MMPSNPGTIIVAINKEKSSRFSRNSYIAKPNPAKLQKNKAAAVPTVAVYKLFQAFRQKGRAARSL